MIKLSLRIFSRALVGHLEGDTIASVHHKSEVITLVERISKVIITIKLDGRTASDIEVPLN